MCTRIDTNLPQCVHAKTQFVIYIFIYLHTTILPRWCTDGRYLYYISATAIFSGTNYGLFRVNSDIFITFRVHQV